MMTQNTVQNLESPGLSGRVDSTTSFPGFSPTRPTERETERGSLSLYCSVGRVGENPRNEVVDSTACPPLQKMAKSANYQYFHFFKTFQKALCTFDCKTVCIFAYSSTREQSNKRSETRLKTVTETGARR